MSYAEPAGKPLWRRALSPLGKRLHETRLALNDHRAVRKARQLVKAPEPSHRDIRLCYLHYAFPRNPASFGIGGGGAVKYLWLENKFPHGFPACDALYGVSSACHHRALVAFECASAAGIPIIWNQNGAYFPDSYPPDVMREGNERMAALFHRADYVLYQSEFARQSSWHFLGERTGPGEVLHNAIDTEVLTPRKELRRPGIVLLAAGSHEDAYRLPLAIQTFVLARQRIPELRLHIAGRIPQDQYEHVHQLIADSGYSADVHISGPYKPSDAPLVYNQAHILLHTKYCDECPSVVIEAMACGLPVVHSATGGTSELVGDAGYGIQAPVDWGTPRYPGAEELAAGVQAVVQRYEELSALARSRVQERFDLRPWLARHEQVIREWIERKSS